MNQDNSQKSPKLKHVFKLLSYATFFILGILTLLTLAFHIPSIQKYTIDRILNSVSVRLERKISVKEFHFSILGFLEIKGLTIENDNRFGTEDMISLDSLVCLYNPISLLRDHIEVKGLYLERPVFRLAYTEDKDSNIYFGRPRKQNIHRDRDDDSQVRKIFDKVRVRILKINNGYFDLDYKPNDVKLNIPLLNLQGIDYSFSGKIHTELKAYYIQTQVRDRVNSYTEISIIADVLGTGIENSSIIVASSSGGTWLNTSGSLTCFTNPRLQFAGSGLINLDDIHDYLNLTTQMHGEVSLKYEGSGLARDLNVTGLLTGQDMDIDRLHLDKIKSPLTYFDKKISISDISGSMYGGFLSGSGTISYIPDSKGMDIKIKAESVVLKKALIHQKVQLQIPGSAELSCLIKSNGFNSEDIFVSGQLIATEKPFSPGLKPLTAIADYHYTKPNFYLDNAHVQNEDVSINMVQSVFNSRKISGTIYCISRDSDRIIQRLNDYYSSELNLPHAQGLVSVTAQLTGNSKDYIITFSGNSDQLKLGEFDWGKIKLSGSYRNQRTMIDKLYTAGPNIVTNGKLAYDLKKKGPARVDLAEFTIDSFDLESLPKLIEWNTAIKGLASGYLKLNNNSTEPVLSQFTISQFEYLNIPFGDCDAQLNWNSFGVNDVKLQAPEPDCMALFSGDFPFGKPANWRVISDNFELSRLNKAQPIPISGRSQFEVYTQLINNVPSTIISVSSPLLTIRDTSAGNLNIGATVKFLNPSTINWNAAINNQTIISSGNAILTDALPIQTEILLTDAQLSTLIAASPLFETWKSYSGTGSGTAKVSTELQNLETLNVQSYLTKLALNLDGLELALKEPFALRIDGTDVFLEDMKLAGEKMLFNISGSADFNADIDLTVEGNVNLAKLKEFNPEIQNPKGNLILDLALSGSAANPDIEGSILLQELYFKNPTFNVWFEDFHGELKVDHKLADIQYFEGLANGAYFSVKGEVGLNQYYPDLFDLKIQSDGITFEYPEGFKSEADLNLQLAGRIPSPLIEGAVNLTRTTYNERINYKSMIVQESTKLILRKRELPSQTPTDPSLLFNPIFKLSINAPDNVIINNNFANIEMKLDLNILGSLFKPSILGEIETLQGTFNYQGREFEITRATLDFPNPNKFDPIIDMTAQAEIGDYLVSMEITGPLLTDLRINLYSTPTLNDLDLVSLIGVGKTTSELTGSSEDYVASGVAYVTGSIQDEIEKRFKYWMGFDEFSIDPILSTTNESASARVTVKKQFNPNLSVTYSRSASSRGDLLIIEYKITDNLYLIGQKKEDGSAGADLRFRWEFK